MGLGINSNISSLIAQKNYSYIQKSQSSSLERLSSGLRINKASDDGSGMYIADQLQSQVRGLGQAVKNANDAVSIVQTADGALDESIKIVETIKTKSIQASQDGHTLESRKVIQSDIDKLKEELDHIARSTSFNGQKLLSGGFSNKEIQVGAYTGETVRISIDSAESTKIGHTTVAEVLPDYTKPIFTTLQDKATGEDIVIKPFQIEYYTPDLMKDELDKLTSEDINKLTNEELGKRTNLDISKLTNTEIDELKNQFIDEIVENASDELNKNISNRLVKNGLGELARQINKFEEQTDVKAFPIVESESSILSGNTSDDFKINGITIGNLNVLPNDSDGSLIAAINGRSSETGVTAHVTAGGTLELKSSDGRAIKVEGLPRPEVISSSALTTHGYLKIISKGFSNVEMIQKEEVDANIIYTNEITSDPNRDIVYNPDNGHFYEFVTHPVLYGWIGSKNFADGSSIEGIQGYLVTITSAAEDSFILNNHNGRSNWTGANDAAVEGEWRWVTGPEGLEDNGQGLLFWLGDRNGYPVNGEYSRWSPSSPSNSNASGLPEDILIFEWNGTWNDGGEIGRGSSYYSIIEYGGMPGDPDIEIVVGDPPIEKVKTIKTTEVEIKSKELLRLCDVNVTSFDDAQIAMEIVDVSLRDLDKIRSNVGSIQNQLQSTIANITNTQFNAAASESTIRDVDFADESSNLSKLQVLSQAGMFALKNSGTSMKNLISLLQQN
ncbi:MAG: flagellin [Desulfamplus sp.]